MESRRSSPLSSSSESAGAGAGVEGSRERRHRGRQVGRGEGGSGSRRSEGSEAGAAVGAVVVGRDAGLVDIYAGCRLVGGKHGGRGKYAKGGGIRLSDVLAEEVARAKKGARRAKRREAEALRAREEARTFQILKQAFIDGPGGLLEDELRIYDRMFAMIRTNESALLVDIFRAAQAEEREYARERSSRAKERGSRWGWYEY